MKIKKRITVDKCIDIPKDVEEQLKRRIEFLKNTPIEKHNNSWEYDNFNILKYHEQLEIAYEDLFGEPEAGDNEELIDWYIEP